MHKTKKLGNFGEEIASEFLKNKGYRIICRNYRIGKLGEIDIISEAKDSFLPWKEKRVVFVEVKTLLRDTSYSQYDPELHVNTEKVRRLKRLCQMYLTKNGLKLDIPWQIDVIAVEINALDMSVKSIRHHENAVF